MLRLARRLNFTTLIHNACNEINNWLLAGDAAPQQGHLDFRVRDARVALIADCVALIAVPRSQADVDVVPISNTIALQ